MRLCIFEDEGFELLYPLTYLRPVFNLKCGQTTLAEKILRNFGSVKTAYFVRDYLEPLMKEKLSPAKVNDMNVLKDDVLLANGRWLFIDVKLTLDGPEEVATCKNSIVFARLKKKTVDSISAATFREFLDEVKKKVKTREISVDLISYPWDLVHHNPAAIENDFKHTAKPGAIEGEFSEQSVIYGDKHKVFIAKNAEVQPFVTLDPREGSIFIDEGAVVFPYSRIQGPCCIGKNSEIHGAKVRFGMSIGPVCRVGGEVEESIIHGYSNKYHDGFLGHSYVCEWVNLGALTTNSDLKNDYSNVEVCMKGEMTDTGLTKVGSFIGDHTKTSIGTFLNTGTVAGIMCNLVTSSGVMPKFIPSFTWFLHNRFFKGYGLEYMVQTAKKAMSRRKVEMSAEEEKLMAVLYKLTKEERTYWIKKSAEQ